jgi:RNA polymerase sporulation-specific sigma factor
MEFTNEELVKMAQDGNRDAVDLIVKNNSGLVFSIVRRFLNRGYEKDDLYQIGCIGLIKAVRKFDTNFNTQFSTYAVPLIMGEIKRFLRDDGLVKVSRAVKENAGKIKLAIDFFFSKNGIEPTVSEISEHLKIAEDDVIVALETLKPTESLNAVINENDKNPVYLIDKLVDSDNSETREFEKLVLKDLLSKLGNKEKQLITMRYFKGATQTSVANMLGISQVQVSRMEKKILENMRSKIAE